MVEIVRAGAWSVSTITEREGPQRRPHELFPGIDREAAAKVLADFPHSSFAPATGRLFHTYQSFVLRTPTRTILIDTCVGEGKARPPHFGFPKQDWLDALGADGLTVEDIDIVINTHMHVDHVGWNTVLDNGRWVPTFPNASYYFGQVEYDFWQDKVRMGFDLRPHPRRQHHPGARRGKSRTRRLRLPARRAYLVRTRAGAYAGAVRGPCAGRGAKDHLRHRRSASSPAGGIP